MALYLGNLKIAGNSSGNVNIVSCDNYEDYLVKLNENIAKGKLSVTYYTPDDGQISPRVLSDYMVLSGDNIVSGLNFISSLKIESLSANGNITEDINLFNTSIIVSDSNKSYNVSFNEIIEKLNKNVTVDDIYPVGSVYTSLVDTYECPLKFGSWQKIAGGRCLFGADNTHSVSSLIEAGLPKPTINISSLSATGGKHTHTYTKSTSTVSFQYDPNGIGADNTGIDANTSGSGIHTHTISGSISVDSDNIYGNSTTVQPPAIAVVFWQRVS